MKNNETPRTIYLQDYQTPDWLVDTIDLDFLLEESQTLVRAKIVCHRNPAGQPDAPLVLDGEELELITLRVDGQPLPASAYALTAETLTITSLPERATIETEVRIRPDANLALSGLYRSGGVFCTQCEAQGFRRITFYPDRPDVMARFTTRIEAQKDRYPVLLSNGNKIAQGDLPDGRHFAVWEDPYRKPCYLFALVAGDLAVSQDRFTTASGRAVKLEIYVEPGNTDKVGHAMASLKKAMKWDEEVFGLEYDLDIFMIVAVDAFNMGAMENKGLNIFNSKFVLARPDTATDTDYENIEGVVAHEYFHNWTGNRVTCRDWFQLSLKEGLTVFRDQEFSSDMNSRAVKRIDDVKLLRTHQFREDASPMSHPVRPSSYVEINNFYTVTVYEKGAEVIRMLHTLLGAAGFRRGMDLYFARHDGQAVTCDDFVAAMADANEMDLGQFKRWYEQAGTPSLSITDAYDADTATYRLIVRQSCPPTPGQPEKLPMQIPVAIGLLGPDGAPIQPIPLSDAVVRTEGDTLVLNVMECEQEFRLANVPYRPVPSLLRGFSAPVKLAYPYSDEELAFLWAHDTDAFNRWDAGQQLLLRQLLSDIERLQAGQPSTVPSSLIEAFAATLLHAGLDPALKAQALTLPAESWVAENMTVVDPSAIHTARKELQRSLATALLPQMQSVLAQEKKDNAGSRALRNLLTAYLALTGDESALAASEMNLHRSTNMTDTIAALGILAEAGGPRAEAALSWFLEKWRHEPLVIDKWLTLQATVRPAQALERVMELTNHAVFDAQNPNRVRALIGAYLQNAAGFHRVDGRGYAFAAEWILRIDAYNPQVAARLSTALTTWRRYDKARQSMLRETLQRIHDHSGLSRDVFEIVDKSLQ